MSDLKKAYRTCALKCHPDKNIDVDEKIIREKMQAINSAYEHLLKIAHNDDATTLSEASPPKKEPSAPSKTDLNNTEFTFKELFKLNYFEIEHINETINKNNKEYVLVIDKDADVNALNNAKITYIIRGYTPDTKRSPYILIIVEIDGIKGNISFNNKNISYHLSTGKMGLIRQIDGFSIKLLDKDGGSKRNHRSSSTKKGGRRSRRNHSRCRL